MYISEEVDYGVRNRICVFTVESCNPQEGGDCGEDKLVG